MNKALNDKCPKYSHNITETLEVLSDFLPEKVKECEQRLQQVRIIEDKGITVSRRRSFKDSNNSAICYEKIQGLIQGFWEEKKRQGYIRYITQENRSITNVSEQNSVIQSGLHNSEFLNKTKKIVQEPIKKKGKACLYYNDGSIFIGQFDQQYQEGIYLNKISKYKGTLQNGILSGRGVWKKPDGTVCEGTFRKGKLYGYNHIKMEDIRYKGYFLNDQLLQTQQLGLKII